MRRVVVAGWLALVLALAGCGDDATTRPDSPVSGTGSAATPTPSETQKPSDKPSDKPSKTPTQEPQSAPAAPPKRSVLAISVDGLSVDALVQLGRSTVPSFFRLLDGGAGTLNARTALEQTVTLPNHTGMLTGRRIDAGSGGHGVTWNEEVPGSVVPGQGGGVESVFDVVHGAGGSTAMFAGKDKFAIYERSWGDAIDEFEIQLDNEALVAAVRDDLANEKRRLTFVHLALPDTAGHAAGWMTPAYLDAVQRTDALLGELLGTIDSTPGLSGRMVVVLTADHGGVPGRRDHADTSAIGNFRVPFVVWGPDIPAADLYDLNDDYRDPGTGIPSYDGPQPVRNADLANVVTDLLGLRPVPGSELNAEQDLDFTER